MRGVVLGLGHICTKAHSPQSTGDRNLDVLISPGIGITGSHATLYLSFAETVKLFSKEAPLFYLLISSL